MDRPNFKKHSAGATRPALAGGAIQSKNYVKSGSSSLIHRK
jgi:hypothetical protein